MLIQHPQGHYRFLKGIDPYSGGVIANVGYEIIHVVLEQPLPWRQGFEKIDAHLRVAGRDRYALCGVELRSPAPFTLEGFVAFNWGYCALLHEWDLYVGDLNPVARTNVAPLYDPPTQPMLHGFSYTSPSLISSRPTLVVAGAGELQEGLLTNEGIIRRGEISPEAMREKAFYVMEVMEARLKALGGAWEMINTVDIYTVHPFEEWVEEIILNRMGAAKRHGIRWYHSRPPIVDIEFEMDMRGVRQEIII